MLTRAEFAEAELKDMVAHGMGANPHAKSTTTTGDKGKNSGKGKTPAPPPPQATVKKDKVALCRNASVSTLGSTQVRKGASVVGSIRPSTRNKIVRIPRQMPESQMLPRVARRREARAKAKVASNERRPLLPDPPRWAQRVRGKQLQQCRHPLVPNCARPSVPTRPLLHSLQQVGLFHRIRRRFCWVAEHPTRWCEWTPMPLAAHSNSGYRWPLASDGAAPPSITMGYPPFTSQCPRPSWTARRGKTPFPQFGGW